MKHQESKLQQECVKWFRYQYPKRIIFAIPNGGKRGIITASIMKAEGVLAGVPDLFIPEPTKYFSGLFIEMKSDTGKLSRNQIAMLSQLAGRGYHVVICRTVTEFMDSVNEYFNQK